MAEELLSLKWNNHQTHFVDILTFLREQEIFIDATLACGGKLYPAHKFVLSTCSDYFKQMFTKNPNKHPIVFMKDVSCRDLEALLDFMYNGEVNVPQSSLGSLIKTAEGLQIKGLAVPDDPPVPKRDIGVVRERRDLKATRDNSYSPPPKRLRAREKSPHLGSSASLFSSVPVVPSRARSPSLPTVTQGLMPLEASVDEDSRTSAQSALSEHSPSMNSKPNLNSQPHINNEDSTSQSDHTNQHNQQQSKSEPSPGPSGLHKPQSKEEEMDIKQEDVVDLGEADEGDWGGGEEGSVDDGGGGDSLASENAPNFSDVLVPPSDGSLNTTGDPAMNLQLMSEEGGSLSERSLFEAGHNFLLDANVATSSNAQMAMDSDQTIFDVQVSLSSDDLESFASSANARSDLLRSNQPSFLSQASNPRPHVCKLCWKAFKRKDHLVEHVRTHTGEKPYMCNICLKRFAKKSNLNAHARCHIYNISKSASFN